HLARDRDLGAHAVRGGGQQRAVVVLQRADVDQAGEGADAAEHLRAVGRGDGLLHQLDGTVAGGGVHARGGVGDPGGARVLGAGADVVHTSFSARAGPGPEVWRMPWARATGSGRVTGYFPEKQAVHSASSGCSVAAIIPSSVMYPREAAPSARAISSMPSPLAISSGREAKAMPEKQGQRTGGEARRAWTAAAPGARRIRTTARRAVPRTR